jgi:hypothetical protein
MILLCAALIAVVVLVVILRPRSTFVSESDMRKLHKIPGGTKRIFTKMKRMVPTMDVDDLYTVMGVKK